MTASANSSEETLACSVPPTNIFSGEDIVPFSDCKTVKQARQHRVARILATSNAPQDAQLSTNAKKPKSQQRVGDLPMEVRKLLSLRARAQYILSFLGGNSCRGDKHLAIEKRTTLQIVRQSFWKMAYMRCWTTFTVVTSKCLSALQLMRFGLSTVARLQAEAFDENDLDLKQLSVRVDEEIMAFQKRSARIREDQIAQNAPPPPPATAVQPCAVSEIGWNEDMNVAAESNVVGDHHERAAGTNFEELD